MYVHIYTPYVPRQLKSAHSSISSHKIDYVITLNLLERKKKLYTLNPFPEVHSYCILRGISLKEVECSQGGWNSTCGLLGGD